MEYGGTYWHRRKMEDSEILQVNSEFRNLERYVQDRKRAAGKYDELLKAKGFDKIPALHDSEPSYLRYPIVVHDKNRLSRVQKALRNMGFNTSDYRYRPLHTSPVFGFLNGTANYPDSMYVSEHILPLPIVPEMSNETIARISSVVNGEKSVSKREIVKS